MIHFYAVKLMRTYTYEHDDYRKNRGKIRRKTLAKLLLFNKLMITDMQNHSHSNIFVTDMRTVPLPQPHTFRKYINIVHLFRNIIQLCYIIYSSS